jgi:hypothetical protein
MEVGCPRNNQIFFFGSNRNKPKHTLFRFIFGLFRETKKLFFQFVSVFRIRYDGAVNHTAVLESAVTFSALTKYNIAVLEKNLIFQNSTTLLRANQ